MIPVLPAFGSLGSDTSGDSGRKWLLLMWGWWQKQSKVLTKGTSVSGGGHAVCKESENKETALGFPSALPQVVLHFVREGRFSSSA